MIGGLWYAGFTMGASLSALLITRQQRSELESLVRKRNEKAALITRARMILLAANGQSNAAIARQMGCRAHIVGKWRRRFAAEGVTGLGDQVRPGRPVEVTDALQQAVVVTACAQPRKGLSRWSVRTLAQELGLPQTRVQRILQAHDLHPHRLRTFNFSPDPQFKDKLLEVVALYLKPPQNAVVLCVDEKTGIQALDRTQPVLALRARKPRSWTNEYVRHGTRTVLASLEIQTGRVIAHVKKRRTSADFLCFLDDVVRSYKGRRLYVILDNLNTHKNGQAQDWLVAHPEVSFHYTPTHASWVNLIECFFSILTRQGLQQSVHKSGKELEKFLKAYFAAYNKSCRAFQWTKGPGKLRHIIELTERFQKEHHVTN